MKAAHTTRDINKNMQGNKKTGRSSRMVILLDMAPPRRSVLEVGIRRVVDWPLLLALKMKDVRV